MNTEITRIRELSPELLSRYIEMRRKIDLEANTIHSITSMLSLLETCGDGEISVDPVALGKINQKLNTNILNIWELMDDFIFIVQAKIELEKVKKE